MNQIENAKMHTETDGDRDQKLTDNLIARLSKIDYRHVEQSQLTDFVVSDVRTFVHDFKLAFSDLTLEYNILVANITFAAFKDYLDTYMGYCCSDTMSIVQLARLLTGIETFLMLNKNSQKVDAIFGTTYFVNRGKGLALLNEFLKFLHSGPPNSISDPNDLGMLLEMKNDIIRMRKEYK